MKQEKTRDRRDVLDKMPLFLTVKMTEERIKGIYDMVEDSIDNPIFVLKKFDEYQAGSNKIFIVNKEENGIEGIKRGSTVLHRFNATYRVLEVEAFRPSFMGIESKHVALLVEEIENK